MGNPHHPELRWLTIATVVETLSLIVLLATRTRLLTFVPILGGLLALHRARPADGAARLDER